MKKKVFFLLFAAIAIGGAAQQSRAQVNVSINIGRQPDWGPYGYDYADYYYLPEYDAYYCVPDQQFYYYDRGGWCNAPYLPGRFGQVNLFNTYKVVVNQPNPWRYASNHRRMYGRYRGYRNQPVLRDYRGGGRYAQSPRNNGWSNGPRNNSGWRGNNGAGGGRGNSGWRGDDNRRDNNGGGRGNGGWRSDDNRGDNNGSGRGNGGWRSGDNRRDNNGGGRGDGSNYGRRNRGDRPNPVVANPAPNNNNQRGVDRGHRGDGGGGTRGYGGGRGGR